MKRFLNRFSVGDDESRTEDTIFVAHGKDIHKIAFLKGSTTDGTITVLDLRQAVQDATNTPDVSAIKLVSKGQTLKDDSMSISSYGVRSGSKVLAMASKSKLMASPPKTNCTTTSSVVKKTIISPMAQIESVQKYIDETMMPLVQAFERSPPAEKEQRDTEHRRLGETIMGELLKLDSVDTDGIDGAEVRKRRKEAVKGMQQILERLDIIQKKADGVASL